MIFYKMPGSITGENRFTVCRVEPVWRIVSDDLFIPFRVLVVDFDDFQRKEIVETLGNRGFTVTGEKQPHNASRVAEETLPELMLIALEMPRLDGAFLMRKLRKEERFEKTPIIALANHIDKSILARLNTLGVKDALTKPVDPEKVLAAVEKYYKLKVIAELMRDD